MQSIGGVRDGSFFHNGDKIPELSYIHINKQTSLYMKNLWKINFLCIFHMFQSHVSIRIYTIERGGGSSVSFNFDFTDTFPVGLSTPFR